jgi:plasmid stabilization system protein ParE
MKIRLLSAAETDLEEGYRFYESQQAGLGSYFLDSLFSDIDSLAYFAGMHRLIFGYHRLLAKRFPFAVYYRLSTKRHWLSLFSIVGEIRVGQGID